MIIAFKRSDFQGTHNTENKNPRCRNIRCNAKLIVIITLASAWVVALVGALVGALARVSAGA